MASIQELQKQVAEFANKYGIASGIPPRLLDLISELGELSKEFLKESKYGQADFSPTVEWQAEFGDVLFSLACLANESGVDLEKCLEHALKKYESRLKEKGSVDSGR